MKKATIGFLALSAALAYLPGYSQMAKKSLVIQKTMLPVKIDGNLNDAAWKSAQPANNFVCFQPTPFVPENKGNESEVYFIYSNDGIYVGGYLHETNRDSIAAELTGRDGFGNNDFVGVVFDTYQDRLNGFEYFVTPLNEQWDAKVSPNTNGNSEDFAWNAVWQSAVKINSDGWCFEMFLPFSAIRFGNKKMQDWGMNVVRQRRKSSQKSFWQSIDPNVNGFLTQEGTLAGFENIKPPLRLQLSPYLSGYYNHDGTNSANSKNGFSLNGGMDVKYGINQAFTLDMTLIPDFGQVQTDNLTLNLSPFELKFAENRPFFTEGIELFNKGNLFYSRRIGEQSKIINATKISGRTQKGLGIGVLNAITNSEYETIGSERTQVYPLTNYNVFVLDQTLKQNSSISFVNTSVLRSGSSYDSDVAAALFDFNDKTNTWNLGGSVSLSNLFYKGAVETGYAHGLYFGKTSGRFNFRISQELVNGKYNKNDLGYFTNNNRFSHDLYGSYNWNKPGTWFNRMNISSDLYYSKLVSPIDFLKRKENMFQTLDLSFNGYAQLKNLWELSMYAHVGSDYNDFYESRRFGRIWRNRGSHGVDVYAGTNSAKKLSGSVDIFAGSGGYFNRTSFNPSFSVKYRFNSKFSVENSVNVQHDRNSAGFADIIQGSSIATDTILFSRRNIDGVENVLLIKYNVNNRMGFNFRARHSYTKVAPEQLYQLDIDGKLQTPDGTFLSNYNKNYNFLSADVSYNWQFNPGSFVTVAWKDIGSSSEDVFRKNYSNNLRDIIRGNQFTSFSVKVIYFLDYASLRNKMKAKKSSS